METIENNEILADFKYGEYKNIPYLSNKHLPSRNFLYDWHLLMGVVNKIELIKIDGNSILLESIGKNAKFIFDDGCRFMKDSIGETKKEAIYNACIDFVKWYNQQKQQ